MTIFRKTALAAAMAFSPSPLFACAACYGGQTNDPLAHGMNWGILTLLGIVVLMLTSIATFSVILIRRAAAVEAKKITEDNLSGAKI